MKIHFANAHYVPQMKKLWKTCFGDTDDYINFYYDNCYKDKNTMVVVEDEQVVAMLTFLPTLLNTSKHLYKGSYVYAVATHPDYRNRGYMKSLDIAVSAVAEYKGDKFLTLVPATKGLFDMYEKIGYKTSMYLGVKTYTKDDVKDTAITNITHLTEKHIVPVRQHFVANLKQSVNFDGYYQNYWYKELSMVGCQAVSVQNKFGQGYLIYYYGDEGKLIVREAGITKDCFEKALDTILTKLKVNEVQIKSTVHFAKDVEVVPYGMMKLLDEKIAGEIRNDVYMNLMLD